jgi:undecaprenyldiphospho-muramoylpentapeptide beta-N-acetylglucosaminyltransferase
VYPALAVLQALEPKDEPHELGAAGSDSKTVAPPDSQSSALQTLWIGGIGGMEADLVERAGVEYRGIPAAGVHGVGARALPGNVWQIGRGLRAARSILQDFRPDVVLFTGGYVAIPVALASRLPGLRVRPPSVLLYVPDIEPGLALKTLARFADRIAVTVEASRAYFQGYRNITVTGYPVRDALTTWDKLSARRALHLSLDLPVLLVVGGSKGARNINRALFAALPDLLPEMQVVHITGRLDWDETQSVQDSLSQEQLPRYHAYPYLHAEMGAALASADLALSRAGASTLGEYPLFGLPAILVPYPYAWQYQRVNAQYLADQGAAIVVNDENLAEDLRSVVQELIRNKGRLESMSAAMSRLARPDAAKQIGGLLYSMVKAKDPGKV